MIGLTGQEVVRRNIKLEKMHDMGAMPLARFGDILQNDK